jgi:hypothetical protein
MPSTRARAVAGGSVAAKESLNMIDGSPGIVERAYQIARTGRAADVNELKAILKSEGYFNVAGQLAGPVLLRALRDLCIAARR